MNTLVTDLVRLVLPPFTPMSSVEKRKRLEVDYSIADPLSGSLEPPSAFDVAEASVTDDSDTCTTYSTILPRPLFPEDPDKQTPAMYGPFAKIDAVRAVHLNDTPCLCCEWLRNDVTGT